MNRSLHLSRDLPKPEVDGTGYRPERIELPESGLCHQADNEWPAELTISLLQGKWKLKILSRLQLGPMRLSQLRKFFPGASKKMLTQHLREMVDDGIVVRSDLSARRRHVEYSLEASLGVAVLHLIGTLADWGSRHALRLSRRHLTRDWPEE
ncbi:winged helix-turn-helix transcriptional regulator [Acidicapsa acidisoli]|uniref:winged helix-turn-helix transcriptional regulator n=1 Tax=Acidicapsa acidisoli TaxID=1615681 RepID=UPI0037BFA9E9